MTKGNRFDYLLIVTIVLLVFGLYGGDMQPIRLLSLAFMPYTLLSFITTTNRSQIQLFSVASALYLFIVLSILWTTDVSEGVKEVVYYTAHFSLFLAVINFYKKANLPLQSLILGWIVFISLTQIVAFNEIFFDQHLELSKFDSDRLMNVGGVIVQKKFAAVTFGNYNTYVTVLAFALPFLFGGFVIAKTKLQQTLSLSIIVFSLFTLFINASRGGLLAAFIITGIFIFFFRNLQIRNLKFILFLVTPILAFLIYKYFHVIIEQFSYRAAGGRSFTEDNARSELFERALEAFYNKPLFGGGIGSIEAEMYGSFILLPHNLFLEIMVQFGFLVFLVFLVFLFKLYQKVMRTKISLIKFVVIGALCSLPIVAIINSSYLLLPVFWVYLASLYCISIYPSTSNNNNNFKVTSI